MTVLHSAMIFIEESLPTYYEAKDINNPLKDVSETPCFRTTSMNPLKHQGTLGGANVADLTLEDRNSSFEVENNQRKSGPKDKNGTLLDDRQREDRLFFVENFSILNNGCFEKFGKTFKNSE